MSYRLLYGPGVERDMSRLPRKVLAQVDRAITVLADNPRPIGCIKMSGNEGLWRVRVGVYRIVYGIDDTERTVDIRVVAHRQDVYRGL